MKKILISVFIIFCTTNLYAQNRWMDSLRAGLAKSNEDTNKVIILNNIADTYVWSYPDTCILFAKRALTLAEKLNFLSGIQTANSELVAAYSGIANYTLALQAGLRNLELAENSADSSQIIWAYANIGSVYFYSGDYPKAISYYRKALLNHRVFQRNKVLFSGFLGETYFHLNQLDSAWHYLQISYKDNLERKYKWPVPYIYIGNVFSVKRQYDSALHYYREAISISNNKLDLIHEYIEMAKVFQVLEQPDSVLYYAKKGLSIAQKSTYVSEISKAAEIVTGSYLMSNNMDSALKYNQILLSSKDSLYSQSQKNLSLNEKLFQSELQKRENEYKSKNRIYILVGGLAVLLLILSFLYRNNRHKQKSNLVLQRTLADLKSTQAQLIQSEKMASLGELTAGIAHEIQNPLNFVNNFSEVNKEMLEELKAERSKPNPERDESLQDDLINDVIENSEKINHHGKRADAIVKGMLQHSRVSTGQKEPTDINALADEYFRLSYHGLRAKEKNFNATMKTDFDESLSADEAGIGKINIIPQDIGRVLLNLFNNAFYAVQQKQNELYKEVTPFQKVSPLYEPTVSVSTKKSENSVLITVSDNGNGIPQKIVDKIFQPFFTTKPTGIGTGLGLSLAYDIIKAHGGEIKVNTEENKFTEFIIQLPLK